MEDDLLESAASPPPRRSFSNNTRQLETPSATSRVKKGCVFAATSLQESFRYVKALVIGQVKKMNAKNEEEATEADLVTAKMQVEAADDAENTKKQLLKYN